MITLVEFASRWRPESNGFSVTTRRIVAESPCRSVVRAVGFSTSRIGIDRAGKYLVRLDAADHFWSAACPKATALFQRVDWLTSSSIELERPQLERSLVSALPWAPVKRVSRCQAKGPDPSGISYSVYLSGHFRKARALKGQLLTRFRRPGPFG